MSYVYSWTELNIQGNTWNHTKLPFGVIWRYYTTHDKMQNKDEQF